MSASPLPNWTAIIIHNDLSSLDTCLYEMCLLALTALGVPRSKKQSMTETRQAIAHLFTKLNTIMDATQREELVTFLNKYMTGTYPNTRPAWVKKAM